MSWSVLLHDALKHFKEIIEERLQPVQSHLLVSYQFVLMQFMKSTRMVDLYGRVGLIEEAHRL